MFWFNIAIGALLSLLCLAAAPVLSAFYNEPKTALVMAAIAPAFVINATGVQHLALLQRELRYVTIAGIEVGSEIVTAVVAIGMAVAGYGYWAVVASVVAGPLVVTVGAWATSGWLPGPPERVRDVYRMLRFGGTITLNGLDPTPPTISTRCSSVAITVPPRSVSRPGLRAHQLADADPQHGNRSRSLLVARQVAG